MISDGPSFNGFISGGQASTVPQYIIHSNTIFNTHEIFKNKVLKYEFPGQVAGVSASASANRTSFPTTKITCGNV